MPFEVAFYPGCAGFHKDARRTIMDVVLDGAIQVPFSVRQVKTIQFTEEALARKLIVGNHYHPVSSDRHELFFFIGQVPEEEEANPPPAAIFRFRKAEAEPESSPTQNIIKVGEACLVPAGIAHAFVPLRSGITMIGLSNKAFDQADDIPDRLF